jgi:glycyl-tRNA synthetase beta chain
MTMPHGNHYLLEIGTEELPRDFLLSAPTELTDKINALLAEESIQIASGAPTVTVYATPRRLAISMRDLPESQEERVFKTKGPPVRVGLTPEGQPSPAGLGFARKVNAEFSELVQETIDGETYLVLNRKMAGRPVREMLAERLPDLILSLSGSHFMAWGNGTIRFARPIRWLVSLWNDEHLPVVIGTPEAGQVQSGRESRGHRVLSQGSVAVKNADSYLETLEKEGVVLVDPTRRKTDIAALLAEAANQIGGVIPENEDLLNTVTMLVEKPFIVTGRFQERFLEIPEEVTTTVMIAHQKYFPVRNQQGKLMPYFLTVSNGCPDSREIIRHGNEKVLTARLEDARFFFDDDRKTPLEERLEALKGITFQKGLGSMYEKALRLETLSLQVADALGYDVSQSKQVARAARLAKADLVTGMVFEFTELQGAMGRQYAALAGEPESVSEAIFEHYLPRFTGDIVARNPVGIAVSLADKIDTMTAVFSQKNAKLPSGSKDPLGLRRMAAGLIQTVIENELALDIEALFRQAYQTLRDRMPEPVVVEKAETEKGKKKALETGFRDVEAMMDDVRAFILQRLKGILLEQDNRYDIIDAALEAGCPPLQNLPDALDRVRLLKLMTAQPDTLKRMYEPANRIYRILGENYNPAATEADVTASALKDDSEKALFEQVKAIVSLAENSWSACKDKNALVARLSDLEPAIARFFEAVMVNDPDAEVRKNRYNLLSVLNRFYLQLACFSKLVI